HDSNDLDRLALKLSRNTSGLVHEIESQFGSKLRYQHLATDAGELAEMAGHVRKMIAREESARHVRRDVDQMEEMIDHLDEMLEGMIRRTRHSVVRNFEWNKSAHGLSFEFGSMDRDALLHVQDRVQNIRRSLKQFQVEMADYYPGVDRVLDSHHPSNRPAVEVRPVVVSPRSTGWNRIQRSR
ncbi:MAG: hypothetical protein ACKVT0_06375, partial [Planctomycetaceae bacterium]